MGFADIDRLFRDVEVMSVCRELLTSGSVAKARMALILLDSLADALVYRRLEYAYGVSGGVWYLDNPRFPKSVRRQARKNFPERLRLAQQEISDVFAGFGESPVTEEEAAVLRIGHTYRNAAYHRDTHNAAVIETLAKIMFGAVAAVFARSHLRQLFTGMEDFQERFAEAGITYPREGPTSLGEAAEFAAATLREGMDVPAALLAKRLADDLESRCAAVEAEAGELPLDAAGVDEVIALKEFGAKHGHDDELIELIDRANPYVQASRRGIGPNDPEFAEVIDETTQAEPEVERRLVELRASAGPPTRSLHDVETARETAAKIRPSRDVVSVLAAYADADEALADVERYVHEAALEWDAEVQRQIDLRRGK
jgi:hypothetical protein